MAIYTSSVTAYGVTTQFELSWTETTSIENNTSTLSFSLKTIQSPAGSGYKRTINASGSSVVINGVSYSISGTSAYHGLVIWSKSGIVIEHNADGTKSVSASVKVNVGGDYVSGSGTIDLTTIPRNSTISVVSPTTNKISISNDTDSISVLVTSKSPLATNYAFWNFNNSKTNQSNEITLDSDGNGTISYGDILDKVGNANSTNIYLFVKTKYTDDWLTPNDAISRELSITIQPLSPSVVITSYKASDDNNIDYAVAGYTYIQCLTTFTDTRGSSGGYAQLSFNPSGTSPFATKVDNNTSAKSGTLSINNGVGTYTVDVYGRVIDGRGNSSSWAKISTFTSNKYKSPTITWETAERIASETDTTPNIIGRGFHLKYGDAILGVSAFTSLDGATTTNNTYNISASYSIDNSESVIITSQDTVGALAIDESLKAIVTVTDLFTSISAISVISTGKVALSIYDLNNEIGIGLGTVAQPNIITCSQPINYPTRYATILNDGIDLNEVIVNTGRYYYPYSTKATNGAGLSEPFDLIVVGANNSTYLFDKTSEPFMAILTYMNSNVMYTKLYNTLDGSTINILSDWSTVSSEKLSVGNDEIQTLITLLNNYRSTSYTELTQQSINKNVSNLMNIFYNLDSTNSKIYDIVDNGDAVYCGYKMNGNKVYTKTISFTTNQTDKTLLTVAHGISNPTRVWIDQSNTYFWQNNTHYSYPMPVVAYNGHIDVSSGTDMTGLWCDKTNIYLYSIGGWNTNWTKVVTLRYY